MPEPANPALERILAGPSNQLAFSALTRDLSGADLTTFLLGVMAKRAADVTAADVMRQYRNDRFVAPAQVDAIDLARVELAALELAASSFEPIALAPSAPLGTHHVLGDTSQNNVVSTARLSEVTADPTNSLALEAAVRRFEMMSLQDAASKSGGITSSDSSRSNRRRRLRTTRSKETVQLAAVHRVVRAQHFEGPRSFAHFSLLGLVTAGRDRGNYEFEAEALELHLRTLAELASTLTGGEVRIQLTPLVDAFAPTCEALAATLTEDGLPSELWLEREHGRNYYRTVCFKLLVRLGDEEFDLGDGGDVWWTRHLLQSRKERLFTGGLGLERIAMLIAEYELSAGEAG